MHRSGTSFLARAFNLYGVYLGDLESLLSHEWKAFEDNPRGHWENNTIYELSEKTLKFSKGSWNQIPKQVVVNKKIGEEIRKCVKNLSDNSILAAGFKDPRLLVCFDSWLKYLPKKFVMVGIYRDPLKVAESLKKRDNFSYEKSLKLWKVYNQNLLKILDKYDGFLLDFDSPKNKLFSQIELVSKKLELAKNVDLSEWYTKELLFSNKSYQKNYVLPHDIKLVYSQLKKRSQHNKYVKIKKIKRTLKEDSSAVENLLASIHNQENYFSKKFKHQLEQIQKTKEIPILQKELNNKSKWAISLDKELKEKNQRMAKLQKEFEQRSKWAISLDKELKEKNQEATELKKEFEQRSKWAISLDKELKEKNQEATELQKELSKRNDWSHSLEKLIREKIQDLANLQKEHDQRGKLSVSLDKELKQTTQELEKLQKEFEQRSEWALSLDKELKEKNQEVAKLQKEFSQRSEWALSLDKELKQKNQDAENFQATISTKNSQMQSVQDELESAHLELNLIKDSVIFGMTSRVARGFDKIAPKSSRRGNVLKMAADAYVIKKKSGTKPLLKAIKTKASKQKFDNTKHSRQIPKIYLQPIKHKKTRLNSNIIKIEEKFKPDTSLRNYLRFGSHNITNLPAFPKISIIIITLDQVDALKRNLASVKEKSTYKNYEIIIVTNNHDENSEMRKFLKTVKHTVCVYDDKYSFGRMNNFGATKAKGEFLLFLNDDVEVITPNWLEAFLSLALNNSAGAIGGKLLSTDGKLQDCGGIVWKNGNAWNYGRNYDPNDPKFNYVREVDYCSGSCLFVKAELFDKIGGFDSRFDPAYWEDADLCFSIHQLGHHVFYQPLAKLVHYEGMTQGTSTVKGLKSYQVVNQKKFQDKWNFKLENHLYDSVENTLLECNRKEGLNILYVDHYIPEPDQDSGSLRTFRILSILSSMGNKITFWPDNLNYTKPYAQELQQKGIEVIFGSNEFGKFLEERKHVFDVAILSRPYISKKYIDSIKSITPHCKIIYDTIDLHFLRMVREDSIENKNYSDETEKMRQLELSLMKKSDITILTSTAEANILHKEDNSLKFSILPNIHIEAKNIERFEKRKNMIFLGGFQHIPNIDSAEFLVNEIWPLIKQKISNAKLYIIGSHPPEKIKNLASDDVVVTGFVKDLTSYYQECKMMLAPLRFGAGVKGKITQSLARGLPIVTTPIGAEGINLVDSKNCMIAEKPEDFAKKAVQVYTDKKLWEKLSINGLEIAKEYSPEKIRACLTATISSILKDQAH